MLRQNVLFASAALYSTDSLLAFRFVSFHELWLYMPHYACGDINKGLFIKRYSCKMLLFYVTNIISDQLMSAGDFFHQIDHSLDLVVHSEPQNYISHISSHFTFVWVMGRDTTLGFIIHYSCVSSVFSSPSLSLLCPVSVALLHVSLSSPLALLLSYSLLHGCFPSVGGTSRPSGIFIFIFLQVASLS